MGCLPPDGDAGLAETLEEIAGDASVLRGKLHNLRVPADPALVELSGVSFTTQAQLMTLERAIRTARARVDRRFR